MEISKGEIAGKHEFVLWLHTRFIMYRAVEVFEGRTTHG